MVIEELGLPASPQCATFGRWRFDSMGVASATDRGREGRSEGEGIHDPARHPGAG